MSSYYVYILTNAGNRVLYIGVTNNISRRLLEHRSKENDGFTTKYNCNKLIYYEESPNVYDAIIREKQLKGWTRLKKERLIETLNPTWKNLFEEV